MIRYAWLLVALNACSSTHAAAPSVDPQGAHSIAHECDLDAGSCLGTAPSTLAASDLTESNPELTLLVKVSDYVAANESGCTPAFEFRIPGDRLTGTGLQVLASWDTAIAPQDASGNDACVDTRADLNVWGRASATADETLVDYRSLVGSKNPQTAFCSPTVVTHGEAEASLPTDTVPIWLIPTHFAGGLRITLSAASGCTPQQLSLHLAQGF